MVGPVVIVQLFGYDHILKIILKTSTNKLEPYIGLKACKRVKRIKACVIVLMIKNKFSPKEIKPQIH